jgi:hypothetical protein
MADVAVIITIVAFFVAAALLTRGLDRVIAETDGDAGQSDREHQASDVELHSGRPG